MPKRHGLLKLGFSLDVSVCTDKEKRMELHVKFFVLFLDLQVEMVTACRGF